ncbi:MAG: SusC/RagA family TonB-linked outer membrane protein, partial [Sediminibacterium sp.]|nr:SusC/RagA family TonB-linked outer membrane protein [Sediminibacterium sp.]
MNKHPHVYKTAAGSGVRHFVCFAILLCSFAVTAQAGWKEPKFSSPFFAPPATITGKVTDAKNAPMEGVSVTIKGTRRGATTNAAGIFSIPNVPENATLVFSYTGFADREVAVKGTTPITVSLTEQVTGLNDVVVVGYGTTTKKDLTGAVSQVKATQLENENPRSVAEILRGNVPGVDVGADFSTKGSNASLLIRGRGALTASTSPLIVLDGVIYPGGLEDINPNDIATIDVLKDASATAVFGSRSSNGVILISTKKGKIGKPVITFNDNIGLNKVEQKPHLLNGQEFVQWRSDVIWAFNGFDSTSKPGVKYKFVDPSKLPSSITVAQWQALDNSTGDPVVTWLTRLRMKPIEITNYLANKSLDWEKLIYNQNALQHDHTISISQRKEDMNYYFSLGYLENNVVTVGDIYKTLLARLNLEANIAKYLAIGVNIQFAERDESTIPVNLAFVQQTTPWGQMLDDAGTGLRLSPNDDPGNNSNPFMDQTYSDKLYKYDNLFVTLTAKGKLPFGFSYEVKFAPRIDYLREYLHQQALNPLISGRKGIVDRRNQTTYSWLLDNIIHWNGKYGKHNIEVTLLANSEKFQAWNTTVHAENFAPNDYLGWGSVQSATLPITATTDDNYDTRDALMARLNYNYNQRYFLTLTERRDGFSGFGADNKRASFTSASAAWALSDEKFMKGTSRWLDYAKIRLSYGENGNSGVGRFSALPTLGSGTYIYVTPGGVANNVVSVFSANLANTGLKWERKVAGNLGLDFSLFKGIVSGAIEVYNAHTKDLLVNRSLPTITGFVSILTNLGEVENKGYEVSVTTQNIKRTNLEWRTSLSFWVNRNKIIHLYGATPDYDATGKQIGSSEKNDLTNNWYIGQDISVQYNYKVIGVWQLEDAALAKTFGYKPGDFRLQDTNGDGQYTIADKQFIGTTTPKFSWNLRNEFRIYKDFDFSFTLYSRIGQIANIDEAKNVDKFYDRANFYQKPYWTPTNPINDYAAINSNAGGPVSWSVLRSSSFVRLSNVSLAYTVPADIVHKGHIEGLKVYMNVVNAHVFTNWVY